MTAERMLIRAANTLPRFLSALLLTVGWNSAFASTVVEIGKVLPPISITQGGQVVIEKDGYRIAPWSGPRNLGQIQVIQYVPGTRRGGGLYDPLTERMRTELEFASYRITAIVNLEAAAVFAKPFVRATVVAKQRAFSLATLVLDEAGTGEVGWDLTEKSAFIVTDASGRVVDAIFGEPRDNDADRIFHTLAGLLKSNDPQ
jgi:predicted transcriptional regulator